MTRIAVAYATLGRPELVSKVIDRLQNQTLKPDIVVISAVVASDAAGSQETVLRPELILGEKGLCKQRNRALAALHGRADIVIFFDDDFVPADDYLEQAAKLFASDPEIVGLTGRVLADGIKTPGIDFDDGVNFLATDEPRAVYETRSCESLYGCNMAIRMAAAEGLLFDEKLPLYGWLEDVDYTYRLSRRGRLLVSDAMVGIHLGTKGGRTSGRKFGYSQIANPMYMLKKRSVPRKMAAQRIVKNIISNLIGCLRPEPYVDRVGRLQGNMIALRDLASAKLDPERMLEMK